MRKDGDKMLKKLNTIHLVLEILVFLLLPLGFILWGINSPSTFVMVLVSLLLAHPLVYLVMMLIKEAKVIEYDSQGLSAVCMGSTILLGCLIWYLFFHLEFNYASTITLWYGIVILAFSLPVIICYILAMVAEKKKGKGGPKFIKR